MQSRKKKYAVNSWVVVVGVLAAVILINILVSVFVSKVPVKIDLTSKQIYEMSDATYEFLKTYDTPTTIYILASEADQDVNIRTILDKYAAANSNIKIKNMSPRENPTFGKKYVSGNEELQAHSVIIDGGDRFKVYTSSELYNVDAQSQQVTSIKAEQKITAGLKFVSSTEDYNAYIVKGHSEKDIPGAVSKLESENYTVEECNISNDEIPEAAKMLIIAAPGTDYTTAELAKIDKFLTDGGKAQFLFDPNPAELPNLYNYLKGWGIEVSEDYAMESSKSNIAMIGQTPLIISDFSDDELVSGLKSEQRMVTYIPYAKVINTVFEQNSDTEVRKILTTSSEAYTKSVNAENLEKTNEDVEDSYTVAALAVRTGETPDKSSAVFVSGTMLLFDFDMDIATQYNFANYDLYTSILSAMQGSKEDYSIASKSLMTEKITVPSLDIFIMFILFVAVVPIAVLVTGLVVWLRRRHL